MKHRIYILTVLALMLGSIVTTQAQEKQNDATWEETVNFLDWKRIQVWLAEI